jgi:hypothetical protein
VARFCPSNSLGRGTAASVVAPPARHVRCGPRPQQHCGLRHSATAKQWCRSSSTRGAPVIAGRFPTIALAEWVLLASPAAHPACSSVSSMARRSRPRSEGTPTRSVRAIGPSSGQFDPQGEAECRSARLHRRVMAASGDAAWQNHQPSLAVKLAR